MDLKELDTQIYELQKFYADIVFQEPVTIGDTRRDPMKTVKSFTISCLPFISFHFIYD
jgi:hypothetical protein